MEITTNREGNMSDTLARFHVTRTSPNGQVTEVVTVWAVDPAQARRLAQGDEWTATLCGPPDWEGVRYGKAHIEA